MFFHRTVNRKLKKLRAFLLLLTLAYGIAFFTWHHAEITKRDLHYTHSTLVPIAQQVKKMKSDLGRLPTRQELQSWVAQHHGNRCIGYYPIQPDFCDDWGTDGENFLVGALHSDWMHYYCSWSHRNFTE